jgi:hypothetical protein
MERVSVPFFDEFLLPLPRLSAMFSAASGAFAGFSAVCRGWGAPTSLQQARRVRAVGCVGTAPGGGCSLAMLSRSCILPACRGIIPRTSTFAPSFVKHFAALAAWLLHTCFLSRSPRPAHLRDAGLPDPSRALKPKRSSMEPGCNGGPRPPA